MPDSNTPSNNGDFAAGIPVIAQPAGGNPEGKELSDPVDVVIDKLLRCELLFRCSTFSQCSRLSLFPYWVSNDMPSPILCRVYTTYDAILLQHKN
jgi:hypothetical protein